MCTCSVISDPVTPWTIALQAPLSMGFPRQDYWRWVANTVLCNVTYSSITYIWVSQEAQC